MKILIITPFYAPDLGPSAPLFTLLCSGLARRGHQVTVIAAVPHYPSGRVAPAFQGKLIHKSMENDVTVVRVAVPSVNRDNLKKRMLQLACFQMGATWASFFQNYDAALITNPALETLVPFACQVIFRHKPVVLSVFDVYPDVGIKLGIFRRKSVLTVVTKLERFCLNQSAFVQIISDSFRPSLRALGVPDTKMKLVKLWVDTELIKPLPHINTFSQEHDLINKFVVLYAGNIGLSQGLEHVLDTAELLAGEDDLRFVFVGNGTGREPLKVQSEHRHLTNVQFIPFQPRERLPDVLASAHVSLVILRRTIGADSLPSKTYSILASGRPIIASVDEDSETWKLVKQAEAGLCIPPEDPQKIAEAILTLKQNRELCDQFGSSGRRWAEQHHSPQHAAEQLEKLLLKAISTQKE